MLEINPDIEIKESPIQGLGIFTKVPIKKGQRIWISKGAKPFDEKIYTKEEFEKFQIWCIENGTQWDSVSLPSGTIKAAVSDRANHPENYGNHSCEPNLDRDHNALRDIEAEEELTIDYTQFSGKDWLMKCNCGATSYTGIARGNT